MTTNSLNVVLFEPEIPQNTGNIVRLCACCDCKLYLIGRLGFSMSEKYLKRSGLDYWDKVEIIRLNNFEELLEIVKDNNIYYFTTKAKNYYTDVQYKKGDFLMFGPESRGLPLEILEYGGENCVKLPMKEGLRSLNLSNTVAVGVYEAVRQIGLTDVLK
ncbi:MAG: tRNA (cytidine(34)-2'-O)-methyltransferase [Cyanobacteria bacterium SIG30]|nr:tRNA (cytidine(34)-2'-O)-methyltransferase [Cyanobacteria bacterium SIG30]